MIGRAVFILILAVLAVVCAVYEVWFGVVLFGGILLSFLIFLGLFMSKSPDAIAQAAADAGDNQKFYLKKYFAADVDKFKAPIFLSGLLIATAFSIMAFNYSQRDEVQEMTGELFIPEDLEVVPPPSVQKPPPPPPPPPPPKLEIVEDEEVLEEEPEIFETEADEETEVEIVEEIEEIKEEVIEEEPEEEPEPEEPKIFTIVEQMPEFPGGEQKMLEFIYGKIKYPPIARENNIDGLVVVNFVVGTDGTISNVKVMRDIGGGCGDEAVRVVKQMPKWKPGKQRGKPVQVSYNLPVRFQLD